MDQFQKSLLELSSNKNIRSREEIRWCDFDERLSSEAIQKLFPFYFAS